MLRLVSTPAVTRAVTDAPSDASNLSGAADAKRSRGRTGNNGHSAARLRALWTIWSVGVRVSLGALKDLQRIAARSPRSMVGKEVESSRLFPTWRRSRGSRGHRHQSERGSFSGT